MKRYSIWVRELGADREVELCQVDTNPTAITGELYTRQWRLVGRRGRRYDTIRVVDNTGEQHGEMPRRRKKKPQEPPVRPGRCLPDLSELKAAMAAAHPDRGGSSEAFIAARTRYVEARQSLRSPP
jgi:hypothetical protein